MFAIRKTAFASSLPCRTLLPFLASASVCLLTSAPPRPAFAVEFGQVDTFEDGTTAGWQKGGSSQLPVTNVADGGPGGTGDNYIQNTATGSAGPDSRQIFYNQDQWAGDYVAAGVGAITMMAKNLGSTTLRLRIAIQGGSPTTRFCSTVAATLVPVSDWNYLEFDLTGPSMTRISGSASLSDVLANVSTVRILSAASPAWEGEVLASQVGVDEIRARGSIIPVLGRSWGGLKDAFRQP